MNALHSTLAALGRRFPRLAAAAKPALLPLLARLPAARGSGSLDSTAAELEAARVTAERSALFGQALERLHAADADPRAPGIGAAAGGNDVLMLVVSDLRIDPRVEREARALAAAGYRVTVICPDLTFGAEKDLAIDWGRGVSVRFIDGLASQYLLARPGFEGGLMFDAAMAAARETDFLAVHAHDLNTCLVGLAVARQTGAHLVADFHEWTSENVHWDNGVDGWAPYPPGWKDELQALEARILREASEVVTVCDSIADALAEELGDGRRPTVIRNIPALSRTPSREYPPLRVQLGLSDDQFLLLYQGGTGPTRLIEPIVEALAFAPRWVLVIRGPSLDLFGEGYRAIARGIDAEHRLILQGSVPSGDVVAAARGADAGIYSVAGICRSFTHALPNKIFEYMASGLALLVADYPEARRMIETHGIGLTFDPSDPRSIAAALNRLIDEPQRAEQFRSNTAKALVSLNADREWQKLAALYDGLPRSRPAKD